MSVSPSRPLATKRSGACQRAAVNSRASAVSSGQTRSPVAADVEEGARLAVPSADEEEALASDVEPHEVAGRGECIRPARAQPAAREDPLLLALEDCLGRVELARQRRRALDERVGAELHGARM